MAFSGGTAYDKLDKQTTIIEPAAIYESFRRLEEQAKEERRHKEKVEQNRIDRMECPVCHSKDKTRLNIVKDNGILGPGFESHVVMTYYVCNDCGVHYSDLKKKKA